MAKAKKILSVLLLATLLFFSRDVFTAPVLSQDDRLSFQKAYDDYLYNYNLYLDAHQEYETAKNAFYAYQTLTAKTEAINKTLSMLQARDDVIRTYLTAIRLRLAEATGISSYEQSLLYIKLDSEIGWYINHRDLISSAGTIVDLIKNSKETERRYPDTESLAYEALITISVGKVQNIRNLLRQEISQLEEKITQIRAKGDKQTGVIERWLLEANNKIIRSQEKENEAVETLSSKKGVTLKGYNQASTKLQEAIIYLKEANSHLSEVIREVKSAD